MLLCVSAYFLPLVNALRFHITKLFLAGLIWSGIGLYLVRPVHGEDRPDEFTRWLETVVKKDTDSGSLQKQIYRLNDSEYTLNALIHEASEIVSRYNEDFNLPLKSHDSDSDHVYAVLVLEWNSYQTGDGMGKAPIPKTVRPGLHPTTDKYAQGFGSKIKKTSESRCPIPTGTEPVRGRTVIHTVEPLSGGIAIGAP